jgi:hypothetical protein
MKNRSQVFGCIGGLALVFVIFSLLSAGIFLNQKQSFQPREAPEAERVLAAQADLPFQILIPGYLPGGFNREQVEIEAGLNGPNGEAMVRLTYFAGKNYSLQISEWIPNAADAAQTSSQPFRCICMCRSRTECDMLGAEIDVGHVRVRVELSSPNLLSSQQVQYVLDTLGPALNHQVYTQMEDVPLSYSLPPAEEVPVNAEGVQEVTLVVTPEGYSPVHFSVKKGIPVRLVFRQLGQVGCGNELIFQWEKEKYATLTLASPADKQVLDFIPEEAGEYRFNCPHAIYRGAMTVID